MSGTSPRPDEETVLTTTRRPPAWVDLVVRSAAFAVVAVGLVGLPLALAGELRRAPTALGVAVVFAGLWLLWSRWQRSAPAPERAGRTAQVVAALAVLVAVGSGVVNGLQHHEHLIIDGDPAVYAVTAVDLARSGDLTLPTEAQTAYAGNETINSAGAGYFHTEDEPTVYPQFFHLLPVMLAIAHWLGGLDLMLLVVPITGAFSLLAFFAFAARVVRPPWALLSTAALAVLLPQLHFSRDLFSEIPSQLLVFAGLALLWDVTGPRAERRTGFPALAGGLVTGLVLGGSAMARIDAFVYLVPLTIGLLLVRAGRTGLAVVAGMAVSAGVALLDGYLGSPVYVESVEGPLLQTAAALLLVGLAAVVLRLLTSRPSANPQHPDAGDLRKVPEWVPRLGRRLAWPVAGLTVALAAFAWFVRPFVQVSRKIPDRTNQAIAGLQEREGLPVDVPRSYDELTMVWLSWYLGPVALALGVAGLAYLSWRVLRGRDLRLAPFVLLVGLVTAVYIWHPGIFPVHYWASRRFLPVSFPGLILMAVLVCERLWARGRRHDDARLRTAVPGVAAVGAAAVLVFPVAVLPGAPLPASYGGLTTAFEQMCGALLPDDVVLIVGGPPASNALVQAVQGYCGVTAASAGRQTRESDVEEVAAAAREAGRRLVLLSSVPEPEEAPDEAEFSQVFDVTVPTPALSLTERPDEVFPYRIRLFKAVLPPGSGAAG